MTNTLLISGHPNLKQSVANKGLLEQYQSLPHFTVRELDALYPDYQIDVTAEQAALVSADLVIIQFPLYWSTYPAILKKWFDDNWTYNFAFGPEGNKLQGKKVIISITAGATEDSYSDTGFNFMSLTPYLDAAMHPLKAAQMDIVDVITTFNMNADANEGGDINTVDKLVIEHAERVKAAIKANS